MSGSVRSAMPRTAATIKLILRWSKAWTLNNALCTLRRVGIGRIGRPLAGTDATGSAPSIFRNRRMAPQQRAAAAEPRAEAPLPPVNRCPAMRSAYGCDRWRTRASRSRTVQGRLWPVVWDLSCRDRSYRTVDGRRSNRVGCTERTRSASFENARRSRRPITTDRLKTRPDSTDSTDPDTTPRTYPRPGASNAMLGYLCGRYPFCVSFEYASAIGGWRSFYTASKGYS